MKIHAPEIPVSWNDIRERKPGYGEPVLLVACNVTQNLIYTLTYPITNDDNEPDYFAPYFLEGDEILNAKLDEVTYWAPIPAPPK